MARDNLEDRLKVYAESTIDKIIDNLYPKDAKILKSFPEYSQKKVDAVVDFLNNFYFRLPGGWYHELYSEISEMHTEKDEMYERKLKILSEIKNCMLASCSSEDELKEFEKIPSNQIRKYIFERDIIKNCLFESEIIRYSFIKYRLIPIMLNAYSMMRKKGYSREELIC